MFRLGWNEPLANTLTGPDAPNLRRIFQSLQNWIDFPFVLLEGNSVTNLAAGVNHTVVWGTEVYDDYTLHDANATTIRVPQQAQQYLMLGFATSQWTNNGTGRRLLAWQINGAGYNNQTSESNATVYISLPIITIVKKADLISVVAVHNASAAQTVGGLKAALLFLPLGA